MKFPMTKRQQETLAVVKELIAANPGNAPSNQEIADAMGISEGAVSQTIKRLTDRGHVQRLPNARRTLIVCEEKRA